MLRTDRLLLRRPRPADAEALAARRNHPEVAKYQDWVTPYPIERAHEMIAADLAAADGPVDGGWWMLTVADADDSTTFGDVVVHLTSGGRTAEIGYTLAYDAWGHGYAQEAVEALVAYLFDTVGVTRVEAGLHPDNTASAMVLERAGLLWEGHTRLSFWLGDDNSDDWMYGMTRPDWEAWTQRRREPAASVRLIEVTADNQRAVRRLRTHKSQEGFVSPVTDSFADALFPAVIDGAPVVPWLRAIEADGELAGFVMLAVTSEGHPEPYLWRLLVDRMHQRRGIGSAAIDLVVEHCRAWGDRSLLVSWVPGKGSPEPLYVARGFVPTGKIHDGEIEARLAL
ncbi:MAG: GNAT family N-acetyltransferase [Ilumatobacteraceae bacterium]